MKIPIINPETTLSETTWLTDAYTSGTSLSVKNSSGFSQNDIVLVGEPAQERSEATSITANPVSDTALVITALKFSHFKDDPVYRIRFDKFVLDRDINDGNGFQLLKLGNLTYDKKVTIYDDDGGENAYKYRVRLKNSITGEITNFSDIQLGSGWTRNAVGRIIRNIRRNLKDLNSKLYQDWELMEEIKNASDFILAEIPNAYWTKRAVTVLTQAGINKYALQSNYKRMAKLWYEYNPTAAEDREYPLRYTPELIWKDLTQDKLATNDDHLTRWTELPGDDTNPNGYFGVYPTPVTDGKTLTPEYFVSEPQFDSYGDLTLCPLPQTYEYYVTMILSTDSDDRKRFENLFKASVASLKGMQLRHSEPRQLRTGNRNAYRSYGDGYVKRTQTEKELYW